MTKYCKSNQLLPQSYNMTRNLPITRSKTHHVHPLKKAFRIEHQQNGRAKSVSFAQPKMIYIGTWLTVWRGVCTSVCLVAYAPLAGVNRNNVRPNDFNFLLGIGFIIFCKHNKSCCLHNRNTIYSIPLIECVCFASPRPILALPPQFNIRLLNVIRRAAHMYTLSCRL